MLFIQVALCGVCHAQTTITTLEQLHDMTLDGNYILSNDIDASPTSDWNDGAGWLPIGTEAAPFTGIFDGGWYTISGLFIDRGTTDYVGLFGYVDGGEISNAGLVDVDVTGQGHVGGLVGKNSSGEVENSYSTGAVTGGDWLMRLNAAAPLLFLNQCILIEFS